MILYIIRWTLIYIVLIFLLHNLYLFFQKNLTTTRIKDYYSIYSNDKKQDYEEDQEQTQDQDHKQDQQDKQSQDHKLDEEQTPDYKPDLINDKKVKVISNTSRTFNNEFKLQMNYELNDFISKIK